MSQVDIVITDEYLLEYLLKKYGLDKTKLINMLKNYKEKEIKADVIKKFYKRNKFVHYEPFCNHLDIFQKWNDSGFIICADELETYWNSLRDY